MKPYFFQGLSKNQTFATVCYDPKRKEMRRKIFKCIEDEPMKTQGAKIDILYCDEFNSLKGKLGWDRMKKLHLKSLRSK